jgi:agmatinase
METEGTLLTSISNGRYNVEDYFKQLGGKPLYITVDIDVFDIAGTGTPCPGGINFSTFASFIKLLKEYKINIIGFDIMELSPHYDQSGFSTTTATLCLKELLLLLRN